MKKGCILLAVVMLVGMLMATQASATIAVSWGSDGTTYTEDGPYNYILGAYTVQLLWSETDPTGNQAVDVSIDPNGLALGEFLLRQETEVDSYSIFSYGTELYDSTDVDGADINNGYVYSRIFTDTAMSAGSTTYYQSAAIGNSLPDGSIEPLPPDNVISLIVVQGGGEVNASAQVVPEPATLALFGLGALVVGLRRRKKS